MNAGTVIEVKRWPWRLLTVELESGEHRRAHVAGALALRLPRLRAGDKVETEPTGHGDRVRIVRKVRGEGDA